MSSLQISQGTFRLSDTKTLSIAELTVRSGESWAFVGSNGSGKSALARALSGELTLLTGTRVSQFTRPTRLSFEQLQKLVSDEWQRNNTDLLSPGEEDTGRTTAEIIQNEVKDAARCDALATRFGIPHLLDRRFKYLSTGETRKALLCQTLMNTPDLLILDEPFDGLDVASRKTLAELLATLHLDGLTLVLVLNRFDEIPEFVQFAGVLADCTLLETGAKKGLLEQALIAQLAHSEKLSGIALPEPDAPPARLTLPEDQPRIVLNNGNVSYNDKPIINALSWTVNPGEHWQIIGPNGAGKSTLLSLVTGDHPQGYSNDLTLFGRRRGSGETIWDIKKHIGYVSSSLHLDYRVSTNVRNVILSGFFDSIGIYQAVSDKQHKLAQGWLDILGIDKRTADAPFHSLSWGQQRLALIVRALVKHPTLLILDEPLQGLDPLNRQLVRRFIDVLISEGNTQLLFVSHHAEDAPDCITHRLTFVAEENGYGYAIGAR
ncbi:molybdate ABC transporter ATP-binding protein ModF [Scandinavium sp. V105_16]|uniref:Molybdate ABC transporter ATP-binding protein ModF n=1 Tax=Scandinavium lactucae TaxID=3095028 RepID=A0AAJ2S1Y5_9ENTR|nr:MULTISPECIES: molybdate ABC transporter ATP-binding protein ModF [unclassified Scandinavium]MDX6021142.1 molybdate ABC transporter ATP-binding protein ModF [Scandinavium sp. V105_16]MDX6032956.1 molybdate ABC transporter ATP-binding protein ModF [Scandinavium sp. V105_12]MDX6041908.1 molybdate ABC transporter ATP-binding protein ModF [Scandinavium sp. V105_6]MDX6049983.1 molybdate ABC transporter ATP-binding protein ModF [Scandinavium sp. V105_1]